VHQGGVALRRLGAALAVFRDLGVSRSGRPLNPELREVARTLGEARDLDVLLARAAPGPLHDRLEAAQGAAHAALDRTLAARETRGLMLDLAEWLATGDWLESPAARELRRRPLREFAADRLDRLRRKLRKHGRRLAQLDPEHRHRVRKDAKKLRYAAEFFEGLFATRGRKNARKFLHRLQRLQDDLGALNDRATAEARLAGLGPTTADERQSFLKAWDEEDLLSKAEDHLTRLLDLDPFWR
jgi:CHAD domain-containing protein